MLRDDVSRLAELHRGLVFALSGYDLRPTLAFGLSFLRHGALHVVGQSNVFDLDRRHLRSPRLGVPVDRILDLLVNARSVRKKLIKAKSANNIAHRCLADLIDRVVDILNGDQCSLGGLRPQPTRARHLISTGYLALERREEPVNRGGE
jgi:hypothetical protein